MLAAAAALLVAALAVAVLVVRSRDADTEPERARLAAERVAGICVPIACRVVALRRVGSVVWRARIVEDHPEGDHVTCVVLPLDEMRRTERGGWTGWRVTSCPP